MFKFLLGAIVMFVVMSLWRRREAPRPYDIEIPRAPASASFTVEELLREGRKIDAIKQYREEKGCGLKEAKDAVEEIERRLLG